jgi:CDP-L-myo-inositol myo-inositolphosphotransferase
MEAGVDVFHVVTGRESEKLEIFLRDLAGRLNVPITTIHNSEWASTENGASVLKASDCLREPFILLMADHIFEPEIIKRLLSTPPEEGTIRLAVDADLNNPLVDLNDVTRVLYNRDLLKDIGKGLEMYNGFDTGIFYCTPVIFDALEKTVQSGDSSLSAAVRYLAGEGRVKVTDISGRFWIDVDDKHRLDHAEKELLKRLRYKSNDGPVSRYINRPLSTRLSRILVRYPLTPNQISLFSFLLSLTGASLFFIGGYPALVSGGIIAQVASVVDGCDGEVARLKFLKSSYGGWLDAVLDRYADAFLLLGLGWHGYKEGMGPLYLLTGTLAIIGSFMVSYTAVKYDEMMRRMRGRLFLSGFRIGRDIRIFLIFLGAVTGRIFFILTVIALLMNLEAVRRLIVCRDG